MNVLNATEWYTFVNFMLCAFYHTLKNKRDAQTSTGTQEMSGMKYKDCRPSSYLGPSAGLSPWWPSVKNLSAKQTWIWFAGREAPPDMEYHSSSCLRICVTERKSSIHTVHGVTKNRTWLSTNTSAGECEVVEKWEGLFILMLLLSFIVITICYWGVCCCFSWSLLNWGINA